MVRLITLTCAWRWLQLDALPRAPEGRIDQRYSRNVFLIQPRLVTLRAMNRPKGIQARRRFVAVVLVMTSLVLPAGCFTSTDRTGRTSRTATTQCKPRPIATKLFSKTLSYACLRSPCRSPARQYRCITTVGPVSFSIGILAGGRRIFVIIARTAAFGTSRAQKSPFILALGACSG
jgi:hypothetical protein